MYDVIIVGGGPAGMTAALYALRNGKTAMVIEKNGFGGQITYSPKVENYPGSLSMSGNEFAEKFLEQIMNQGADVELEEVVEIIPGDIAEFKPFIVKTAEGSSFEAKAVVLATGVKHRMLGLPGEELAVGNGISFCAVCDGDFYKGQTVVVAGGGNSALQEAILLAGKCAKVIVLQDLPQFTGEKKLQDILFAKDNVESHTGVTIEGLNVTDGGRFLGVKTNIGDFAADGLFEAIGLIPENENFSDVADLNKFGYFDSAEDCRTKTPGIFVAGDARSKTIRQITTAVSDGAIAAMAACNYIDGH
ncbi:MAG: FAD-dependent oxidoreductase [Firmicutes bacterium]|nr:FAD-dependent oxidoreductase [Bacillota bacterium]